MFSKLFGKSAAKTSAPPPEQPGEFARFEVSFGLERGKKDVPGHLVYCNDRIRLFPDNQPERSHTWAELKRWAVTPNALVLDFGEFEKAFIEVKGYPELQSLADRIQQHISRMVAETAEGSASPAPIVEEQPPAYSPVHAASEAVGDDAL